ncbi:sensor histidine kinase [Pseudonocardia hydrocarbonoxydans]|uniref:histidine kinase n=1 Tax=Pseudonocardia hydrocarbonoxydans TaxID=76726 RepID=A0A4Y3WI58_9PSEU|nr:HAMP domain-containing sensor histidine kinase [Pseudonocardia hydrocarbonoxydans]GEC18617.1 two-component sensor histidine kinase [Pseudonocardia hydrocarbonoxydans]
MRRRIVLTVVAVCVLGIAVLFVPLALVVGEQNRNEDLLELQRMAAVAAHRLPDLAASPFDADLLGDGEPDQRYAVYDAAGRKVAGDGPPAADPVVAAALADTAAAGTVGSEIVGAVATGPGGGTVTGAVRVAEPLADSVARTRNTIAMILGVALSAIGVAALAGALLVRRLLRPLDRLREAATRLGDGDFTVTAPRSGLHELDQVAAAVDSAASRIGRLVERERAFSADASHQLKTPLAAARVVVETELMVPRPDPTEALRETLEALERMNLTVTELLTLARDDHTTRTPVRIADLLADAERRWSTALRRSGRTLVVDTSSDAMVRVSAVALGHVLDVLLDNARGHGAGPVVVTTEPVAGGVAVAVADSGSLGATAGLFHRRQAGASGTGIGLALARALAEAEGARLRLRSASPTTFELLIPAVAVHSASAQVRAAGSAG